MEKPPDKGTPIYGAEKISMDKARELVGEEEVEKSMIRLEEARMERFKKMGVELSEGSVASQRRIDYQDQHGTLLYIGRPTGEGKTSTEDTTLVYFIPDESK